MWLYLVALFLGAYADRLLYSSLRTNGTLAVGRRTDVHNDPIALSIQLDSISEGDNHGCVVKFFNVTAARTTDMQKLTSEKTTFGGLPVMRYDHVMCLSGTVWPCNGSSIQTTVYDFLEAGSLSIGAPAITTLDTSLSDPRSDFILLGCDGSFQNSTVRCPEKDQINLHEEEQYVNGAQVEYSTDVPSQASGVSLEFKKIDSLQKYQHIGYTITPGAAGDVVEIATYIKFVLKLPTTASDFGFAYSDFPHTYDSAFLSTIKEPDVWYYVNTKFRANSIKPASAYLDLAGAAEGTVFRLYNFSVNVYPQAMTVEEGTVKFGVAINNWQWQNVSSKGSTLELAFNIQACREGGKGKDGPKGFAYNFNATALSFGPYDLSFSTSYNRDNGPDQKMPSGFPLITYEKAANTTSGKGGKTKALPARFSVVVKVENDNTNQFVYDPYVFYNKNYVLTTSESAKPAPKSDNKFPSAGVAALVLLFLVVGAVLVQRYRHKLCETFEEITDIHPPLTIETQSFRTTSAYQDVGYQVCSSSPSPTPSAPAEDQNPRRHLVIN